MLQDSCLLCLAKAEVAQLAATSCELRTALGHWLFLRHARPHTSLRLYRDMLAELRRMGLFPLYVQLHSPLNVRVLQVAFAYFKDRQSQFATPSISRFFRFTTPPATVVQAQDYGWKQSRIYLQGLQACLQQRHLYSYLALCTHAPEHAARRYPLGAGGLQLLEQLVSDSLWPSELLQLLLRELHVPQPLLWWPLIALAERRFARRCRWRRQQWAFTRWRGRPRRPPCTPCECRTASRPARDVRGSLREDHV